ncbi:MAG: hypothetical protein LBJ70_06005 [Holosporales bacterium]|jgi:flagellar hook protein FlgE|nr:hypothetical protein [Holosporales bacterium]
MHLQTQGELQRTDQPLDLAFDGDGLLLVRDKSGTLGGARTGTFHVTKEGRIQDSKGLTLQGWPLLPEGAGSTASAIGNAGVGTGASAPGGADGDQPAFAENYIGPGSAGTDTTSTGIGTAGAGTLLGSGTARSNSVFNISARGAAVQSAPPPSTAFIGPLGGLEDIQLLQPEPAPPQEVLAPPPPEEPAPLPEEPPPFYGTGWSMRQEADGLYSFHGSEVRSRGAIYTNTFVDSLGQKRTVEMEMGMNGPRWEVQLTFAAPYRYVRFCYDPATAKTSNLYECIQGETAKQVVVTFEDTGAKVTFDFSDIEAIVGDTPNLVSGDTLAWGRPPMIFGEGTYKIMQQLVFNLEPWYNYQPELRVEKGEDGSFAGVLIYESYGFEVELYFDEEGRVSGHKFLKNGNSTSDPSVGVKQTGAIVKGVHLVNRSSGSDNGTIDIDLRYTQIIDTTKPPKAEVIPEEVHEEIPAEPLEQEIPEEVEGGFAPLSPSSLSIDENGVLKRLKDDGDWEPLYLLACGQFAATNAAEERNGVYYATPASGALRTGVSGKDGMGTITAGTLERSTTDLAHELSEMIRAQHAYAANTKVLSTIEDMLTELERL